MTSVFLPLGSPVLAGKVPELKAELKLLVPVEKFQGEVNSDRCPVVEKHFKAEFSELTQCNNIIVSMLDLFCIWCFRML